MRIAAAMVCVALAGSASAQVLTSTQIVPFDYGPGVGIADPEFQLFDTMGGTRELVGVTLSYDQTISFTVQAEQNSPVQIEEGVFFADVSYISLHQLGVADDGGGDDGEHDTDRDDGGGVEKDELSGLRFGAVLVLEEVHCLEGGCGHVFDLSLRTSERRKTPSVCCATPPPEARGRRVGGALGE